MAYTFGIASLKLLASAEKGFLKTINLTPDYIANRESILKEKNPLVSSRLLSQPTPFPVFLPSPLLSSPLLSPLPSSPLLSSPMLSGPIPSCTILSCPVLPILSCPLLSCLFLSLVQNVRTHLPWLQKAFPLKHIEWAHVLNNSTKSVFSNSNGPKLWTQLKRKLLYPPSPKTTQPVRHSW